MRSTSQKTRQMKAAVEAILFAMGGSVEVEKIAAALEMKVESTEELLADMMEQYKKEDRGIQIVELEHAYQLCTKKEMYEYLIRVAKQPKKATLSDVALETLSIIAYKQTGSPQLPLSSVLFFAMWHWKRCRSSPTSSRSQKRRSRRSAG